MQFSEFYKKWQKEINKVALLFACISSFLEIIVSIFIFYFLPDMFGLVTPNYVLKYIALPSALYFLLVLLGRHIININRLSDQAKNFFSILILTFQIFIIACVHNFFVFPIVLFSIPIILTLIYSNKKMTNIITIISVVLILISSMITNTGAQENIFFHAIEVFIAIILVIGCNIITNLVITVEKDKNDLIKSTTFKQLQLEELIKCDPLTGLYNIASFYNSLDTYIKNSEKPLSLAVIDIDNFKAVNDTWGHEKANEVLIYIAAQLQSACNTKGYVFRYGGEEFTIIFPKSTPLQAKAIIEVAKNNIFHYDFDVSPKLSITFSCGIAAHQYPDYNAHDLFQLADKIMYQAKFTGKNQTLIDPDYSSI